jgi:plasmid segregation protein ParM
MYEICVTDSAYYEFQIYQKRKFKPSILYSIRSKIQQTEDLIKQENTYVLEIDQKKYAIGEGAEQYTIDLDKTNNEFYRLLNLTGIGLIFNHEEKIINLVTNYPLNLFNKENKEKFEEHLKTEGCINYKVNNEEKNIWIKNCLVFPQTLPVIYVNQVLNQTVAILDIGGLTAQGVVTKNKNMIQSSVFTENLGILVLQYKIKKELNSKYNINLQDYQLGDIIKNGLSRDVKRSKSLINEICEEHVKEIIKQMQLTGWNIEDLYILATGGGSLFLSEYLKKYIPNLQFSNDPVRDNVKGLWKVAEVFYEA